ncbi:hypothetical protein Tco_1213929 [Tanacetum coccineum]
MYLNFWSYKAVRHMYSNPIIQPELEGSTQGYLLVSVEVLRDYTHFYRLSHSELVDIEKVTVCSSLRSLKDKVPIEFDTSAGNPVNEILLKLNLPDHRIFKDGCEGNPLLVESLPSLVSWSKSGEYCGTCWDTHHVGDCGIELAGEIMSRHDIPLEIPSHSLKNADLFVSLTLIGCK